MRQGKRKEREGEKAKSESRKCCATFLNPKTMWKFCFLRMPNFASAYFAPGCKGRGVYNLETGL